VQKIIAGVWMGSLCIDVPAISPALSLSLVFVGLNLCVLYFARSAAYFKLDYR